MVVTTSAHPRLNIMAGVLAIVALFGIAFGAIWMGYEQHRANGGIFVPFPSPQTYHLDGGTGSSGVPSPQTYTPGDSSQEFTAPEFLDPEVIAPGTEDPHNGSLVPPANQDNSDAL